MKKSEDKASRILEPTPIGPLTVFVSREGLAQVDFGRKNEVLSADPSINRLTDLVIQQFQEYFYAGRREFTFPIDWRGFQPYQEKVLRACLAIPYGQTRTYGELAKVNGGSARAVGGIMAGNPIPIVIPCHRVVGSDGKLHGYGSPGGVEDKARLLTLEGQRIVA